MKKASLIAALLLAGSAAFAQDDPTIMVINGVPVARSEFEYSYNKNNADGVIDKKSLEEYVDLFVNYKLKVAAALDAKLDTLSSFKKEYAQYRDQQVRPTMVTDADVEAEARNIYDKTKASIGDKGLIHPAHIFLAVGQKATAGQQDTAKQRIDSIYAALKGGADFAEMAKRLSQDKATAQAGGQLPWLAPGQTLKEFDDVAFALKVGEMSEPFLSPAGYHIVLMKGRKQLEPYDSLRANIMRFIEQRNLRDNIAETKLDMEVRRSGGKLTREQVLEREAEALMASNPEVRNLLREYHDGLLLYEISNREVWEKAAKDSVGLEAFFKKNKKKYAWKEPRYKGMALYTRVEGDVDLVKDCIKGLKFVEWNEALRNAFNKDTVRIRVEKGIFKKGDNGLVDSLVFDSRSHIKRFEGFPYMTVYGKLLKNGPEEYTDVRGLVTADYQDALEKEWVAALRRKYVVAINKTVLKTVNNH